MANQVWIGIDPGSKITGLCIGERTRTTLRVYSERISPHGEYAKNPNTRMAQLRNSLGIIVRRVRDKNVVGVAIEDPIGIKGHANILHELVGAYVVALFDNLGTWTTPIYRISQPALKKFAINGNPKRDEAIMKMSARALKEYHFEADTADEIMAFWLMQFAYGIHKDPVEKFRLETIERYKKKRGL